MAQPTPKSGQTRPKQRTKRPKARKAPNCRREASDTPGSAPRQTMATTQSPLPPNLHIGGDMLALDRSLRGLIATEAPKSFKSFYIFHAFRHYLAVHIVAKIDGGLNNNGVIIIMGHVHDEGAINLDL